MTNNQLDLRSQVSQLDNQEVQFAKSRTWHRLEDQLVAAPRQKWGVARMAMAVTCLMVMLVGGQYYRDYQLYQSVNQYLENQMISSLPSSELNAWDMDLYVLKGENE